MAEDNTVKHEKPKNFLKVTVLPKNKKTANKKRKPTSYFDEVFDGVAEKDEVHALAADHFVVLRQEHGQPFLRKFHPKKQTFDFSNFSLVESDFPSGGDS